MSNLTPSNQALNTGSRSQIFILYVPLQPNKKGLLVRYFHSSVSVFFGLIDRLKPIAICSSWRVRK